jgi:hypothetical protein
VKCGGTKAICIMGSGFGSPIEDSLRDCRARRYVPEGHDYLAAPMEVIVSIGRDCHAPARPDGIQLSPRLYPHYPLATFAVQECEGCNSRRCRHPTKSELQIFAKRLQRSRACVAYHGAQKLREGAIIIGHSPLAPGRSETKMKTKSVLGSIIYGIHKHQKLPDAPEQGPAAEEG